MKIFDTEADLALAVLNNDQIVQTKGQATVNDLLGNVFLIEAADGGSGILLASTNFANPSGFLNSVGGTVSGAVSIEGALTVIAPTTDDNPTRRIDYANTNGEVGGTVKMRVDGTTLYIRNDGTDA